eukprot:13391-Heterococcus_DN1.PRE.3
MRPCCLGEGSERHDSNSSQASAQHDQEEVEIAAAVAAVATAVQATNSSAHVRAYSLFPYANRAADGNLLRKKSGVCCAAILTIYIYCAVGDGDARNKTTTTVNAALRTTDTSC